MNQIESYREQVFPTRMTLGLMKTKLKGAQQGHSLLKRKSEALTKRFRDITKRIDDVSYILFFFNYFNNYLTRFRIYTN